MSFCLKRQLAIWLLSTGQPLSIKVKILHLQWARNLHPVCQPYMVPNHGYIAMKMCHVVCVISLRNFLFTLGLLPRTTSLTHSFLCMHLWWSTHCVQDAHMCVWYHCIWNTRTRVCKLGSCKQEYRVSWWSCQCQNLFLFISRAFPAWYSGRIETKKAHFDQF